MSEFINGWRWDIYHIGVSIFWVIILWRVITLAVESYKINKRKVDGKSSNRTGIN